MRKYSEEDILKIVCEKEIEFIRLQFTDIFGKLKNVETVASQLEKILSDGCTFDGSSIEGFARIDESDMFLKPDCDSFAIFPYKINSHKVARLICDVYNIDNTPFSGDPRNILKKVIKQSEDMGYSFNVGPECEFFLFKNDNENVPTTQTSDNGSYFDLGPIDLGERCRREICLSLKKMGFEIEASHHEVAEGQHEIDFKFDEALKTADNVMTFKYIVKTCSQQNKLHATFMPKPVFGINGSGMHTNMSLFKNGTNAFFDSKDKFQLSKEAYMFIGGLLSHIKGITAIANPLVNSYKRLVAGYEAPVYISWSTENRSSLIRVPSARGNGTRVELRSPDPSCNPYLEMALCLAAGLDGIKQKTSASFLTNSNVFSFSEKEREVQGIETLPQSLFEAINEMKKDKFIKKVLGEHVFEKYYAGKLSEWEKYRTNVTKWELDHYFIAY